MQIVGGRWEVCLGDGSCVLSPLSLPSAGFNLYITGQARPGRPPADVPPCAGRPGAWAPSPHTY